MTLGRRHRSRADLFFVEQACGLMVDGAEFVEDGTPLVPTARLAKLIGGTRR